MVLVLVRWERNEFGMRNGEGGIWNVENTEIVAQNLTSDFKPMKLKWRSGATSSFDVQRWTFDVRRSRESQAHCAQS